MPGAFTPEAESELESQLKTKVAENLVRYVDSPIEGLRKLVEAVALQAADERGDDVKKRDIVNAWEIVTEWGNLVLWRQELKKAMESI